MPPTRNTVAQSELSDLPPEILTLILESLPTTDLIPILGLSTLLHETTSDVLHHRIRDTFSDPSTELILECFDDHDRISAPSLSCRYIETARPPSPPSPPTGPPNLLENPLRWQSRFRIVNRRSGETRWPRPRHTTPITPQPEEAHREEEAPTKDVTIGEGEEGVALTLRALIETGGPAALPTHLIVWEEVASVSRAWFERAAAAAASGGGSEEDGCVLWLGGGRNCGLRVRVRPLNGSGDEPVLVSVEERPAVSYRMEYRELLVRSMLPLVAVDRTVLERSAAEGSLAVVQVAL